MLALRANKITRHKMAERDMNRPRYKECSKSCIYQDKNKNE